MDKKILFEMLETPSVSGNEFSLQRKIKSHMENYADEIMTDLVGNLVSVINPESEVKVLLAAHADEIGLMITRILEMKHHSRVVVPRLIRQIMVLSWLGRRMKSWKVFNQ